MGVGYCDFFSNPHAVLPLRRFGRPLTSAEERSAKLERVMTLSVLVGPPCTWVPVYRDLSSWNLLGSACCTQKHLGSAEIKND
jgi:hypothetical protein